MKSIVKWGSACAALLAAAGIGFAAGRFVSTGAAPAAVISQEAGKPVDTIEEFRTERQQLRQMQLSQLNEIIFDKNSEAEIVSMAQQRQMELMEWAEQEQTLEGLLALRDFEDVLVTVHTDSVNVMVRSESVSQQQAAVILELVMRETGISGGNVKIVPIN